MSNNFALQEYPVSVKLSHFSAEI